MKIILVFSCGVLWLHQLKTLPTTVETTFLLALIVCFAALRCWRLMFVVMGVLWAGFFAGEIIAERLPPTLENKELMLEGYIASLPKKDERKVRFDFIVTSGSNDLQGKLRLNWYYPKQPIKAGQYWRIKVKLKRPHGLYNPHGFDYEQWLLTQRISAIGYVRQTTKPVLLAKHYRVWDINIQRQKIIDKLADYSIDKNTLALIKALLVGDRSGLSFQQWQVFRHTGTVHLMAISGLHIGLIASLVYFLILKLWGYSGILRYSPPLVAAYSAITVATFYAALAGFSIPTRRALIMLLIAMLAIIWQRNVHPLYTLLLALFAVLLFDPFAMLSAGFWLSFAAVFFIIYGLTGRLLRLGYWWTAIRVNALTSLGLMPLILYFFQQVSLISPLANFVAVPVISLLVVPLLLLAVVLMFILPILAGYVFNIIDGLLQSLWWFLAELSNLPFSLFSTAQFSFPALLLALIGMVLIFAPKGIPARFLGLVLLLPMVFVPIEKLKPGALKMTLLDVGQGLAVVLQTAEHNLIFDTGAKYSQQYDMGKVALIPFLTGEGLTQVDRMIISHGDNDHIGGAEAVLQAIPIKSIFSSVPEKFSLYPSQACYAGQHWQWDQVKFTLLSPEKTAIASDNNNSCVLKVESLYGSVLLTGDIEQSIEHQLVVRQGDKLSSDILIAPHHGSKTSSSMTFIKQVAPKWVLIPAGYKNRFNFPHQQVLNRYKKLNIPWLNVADTGAITVNFNQQGVKILKQRELSGHYWNNLLQN